MGTIGVDIFFACTVLYCAVLCCAVIWLLEVRHFVNFFGRSLDICHLIGPMFNRQLQLICGTNYSSNINIDVFNQLSGQKEKQRTNARKVTDNSQT